MGINSSKVLPGKEKGKPGQESMKAERGKRLKQHQLKFNKRDGTYCMQVFVA